MAKQKPDEMSDEMWAAVCIIMEDNQISSYKELTESHKAVIERMDQMENKWAEVQAHRDTGNGSGPDAGTGVQDGTQSGVVGVAAGVGEPVSGGEGSPPPVVEPGGGEDDKPKGSGRGGRPRWYEREGYAK